MAEFCSSPLTLPIGLNIVYSAMNVLHRQAAVDPQTKPIDLDRDSACRLLESKPIYQYSARNRILNI